MQDIKIDIIELAEQLDSRVTSDTPLEVLDREAFTERYIDAIALGDLAIRGSHDGWIEDQYLKVTSIRAVDPVARENAHLEMIESAKKRGDTQFLAMIDRPLQPLKGARPRNEVSESVRERIRKLEIYDQSNRLQKFGGLLKLLVFSKPSDHFLLLHERIGRRLPDVLVWEQDKDITEVTLTESIAERFKK